MKRLPFFISFLLLTLCAGCRSENSKLAKIDLAVEVQRFDKELLTLNPDSLQLQIPALQQKYGDFFAYYCTGIIDVGAPQDSDFFGYLADFLRDDIVREAYREAQRVFPDCRALNAKLTDALKRYKLHFPNDKIPSIITYVSGFNQSIMLAEGAIGIGLDKYLGADYSLYPQLGFYKYMARKMYPAKIPADVMDALAEALFPYASGQDELLRRIIWEGKRLYFVKQMLPADPDTAIFGFTQKELDVCHSNEAYIWLYLIENKLLFSTNAFTISKFTEDRPFTQEFSREAPGRTANWVGYRIVSRYMKRNPSVTLPQLMLDNGYRQILEKSGYNPK
ncbi:MAG: hypothetical protein LBK18_06940 [Prevotellaceae bacterium]|jgi:hypothetical protein|nr:hypothetical protein [Prevotellaceae bacterium]